MEKVVFSKKGLKLTNDEFIKRLDSFGFTKVDEYVDSITSISFKCSTCNKLYKRKPKELSQIKCSCKVKHIEYEDIVSKNFIVLENYKNIRHKILHQCKICNLIFKTSPKSIINSVNGCPSCSGRKFSIDAYKSKLPKDISFISSEYIGSNYHHLHKCNSCDFEWMTKPNYILHMKTSCPNCSSSKGEKIIAETLNKLSIHFKKEYSVKIDNVNYRFDFFIEDLNLVIEFDGIQHFKPVNYFGGLESFEKIKLNDHIKDKWCHENSIKIIRIPYDVDIEFFLKEILKQEVIF